MSLRAIAGGHAPVVLVLRIMLKIQQLLQGVAKTRTRAGEYMSEIRETCHATSQDASYETCRIIPVVIDAAASCQ